MISHTTTYVGSGDSKPEHSKTLRPGYTLSYMYDVTTANTL